METSPARTVLSVSQLNAQVRQLLETLPLLWVEGEISNLSRPSSGHWYFSLKDSQAQIRAAMFKNRNMALRVAPRDGDKVLVRARVSLYEGRGDYQLIVEHLEPAGLGDLQRQYELLRAKLSQEGLFDSARKQELPYLPQRIALITSATGAAVRDLIDVLGRRMPLTQVLVMPVAVQGQAAPGQICQAIARANQDDLADLLIIGRGGGSLEDLWAFNDEQVVRAIAASNIPTISAVGHETDTTLADFAADVRAPTPSAAAELAVPAWQELHDYVAGLALSLTHGQQRQLQSLRHRLSALSLRLINPANRLQQNQQRLDFASLQLDRAISQHLSLKRQRLDQLSARLHRLDPALRLGEHQARWQALQQRLGAAMARGIEHKQQQLQHQAALLDSYSPLPTLRRGYNLAVNSQGQLVRQASQLAPGDPLRLRFSDGTVDAQVLQVHPAT